MRYLRMTYRQLLRVTWQIISIILGLKFSYTLRKKLYSFGPFSLVVNAKALIRIIFTPKSQNGATSPNDEFIITKFGHQQTEFKIYESACKNSISLLKEVTLGVLEDIKDKVDSKPVLIDLNPGPNSYDERKISFGILYTYLVFIGISLVV